MRQGEYWDRKIPKSIIKNETFLSQNKYFLAVNIILEDFKDSNSSSNH